MSKIIKESRIIYRQQFDTEERKRQNRCVSRVIAKINHMPECDSVEECIAKLKGEK